MNEEKRLIVKALRLLDILEAIKYQPLIREIRGILLELLSQHE